MQKIKLKYFHLIRKWKKFNSSPAPFWIQNWAQISSVFFAIVAIILTIQNGNQNEQLQQLANISSQNSELIKRLDSIQHLAYMQSEPNLQLKGSYQIKKIKADSYVYLLDFINVGGRPAEDAEVTIAIVLVKPPNSRSIAYEVRKLSKYIPFNQDLSISDTLRTNSFDVFSDTYFTITFAYLDPLTKKKIIRPSSYYRHIFSDGKIIETVIPKENEIQTIDKIINDRNRSLDQYH